MSEISKTLQEVSLLSVIEDLRVENMKLRGAIAEYLELTTSGDILTYTEKATVLDVKKLQDMEEILKVLLEW